jgi:AcrR family transcriptional regulator
MKRRRRTAEAAKTEILEISERLLVTSGPESVRLEAIAQEMGVSHPTILHHFGSIDGVFVALQQKVSRQIREDLLGLMKPSDSPEARVRAISKALAEIAKPEKGRLLAWLVASGRDPYPPVEEQGMAKIAEELRSDGNPDDAANAELMNIILLALLAMIGESMVGDHVRARLGPPGKVPDRDAFRAWLLGLLGKLPS